MMTPVVMEVGRTREDEAIVASLYEASEPGRRELWVLSIDVGADEVPGGASGASDYWWRAAERLGVVPRDPLEPGRRASAWGTLAVVRAAPTEAGA